MIALSAKIGEAGKGAYAIFYEDELAEALPDDLKNRETLEAALKKLVSDGCIDVKYARGNVFCIASLKDFTVEDSHEETPCDTPAVQAAVQPAEEEPLPSLPKKLYAAVALSAFAGGAFAGAFAALLGAVL